MFADPQSVTINAVANSLARVEAGLNRGSFSKDDQTLKMSIQHQLGNTSQRMIRLDRTTLTASPFTAGSSYNVVDSVWLVSRTPKDLTIVQQKQLIDGFLAYLTASSGARITQWLGGES